MAARGLVRGEDDRLRCAWAEPHADYRQYHDDEWGRPVSDDVRSVARAIAIDVVKAARDLGLGRSMTDEQVETEIDRAMWYPHYPECTPAPA